MAKISEKFNRNNTEEETPDLSKLKKTDYPAGRKVTGAVDNETRTLTANMTGQVTLSGTFIDLQFNKGCLKRISDENSILIDKIDNRSYFTTSERKIEYRNESAFSFESDPEYGLRTLQIPKNRVVENRIITDFIFHRETEECYITAAVDYPDFEPDEIVKAAAPFELRFRNRKNGISIKPESGDSLNISPGDELNLVLKGNLFEIRIDDYILELEFRNSYNSRTFSVPAGLTIKTETVRLKKCLFINPGGSYTPAPAEFYSGTTEQFCIRLGFRKKQNS